ncbi:Glucosamine-phosphate N-acetyltransferase [Purpureocillium takamizusanense]|uniref:Glucosamine 6-phosphate N-acetyltransferase n=1 Tax=Purpureocillium takamizusanense TaxID=2060973 RepID=A0A9Q8Q9D6_9HYPO|nr:Glucosamine-phosphate N-acetyltransferase [Purpureocillium takamizusanense]UNI15415.1 Glucosamine-phosphate N-acetyltransferase [Purpureocillium takamizusanense]
MPQPAPLFPPSLIDASVAAALPSGFTIRPLARDDHAKGFLECLRDLTWTGEQTADEFAARYDELDTQGKGPYYYLVIEHEGCIVGTGAVIVEKKFIWNRASVGHVEEICVAKGHQGKGLGVRMIEALDSVARNVGCTKSILNCSADKEAFYARCGYKKSGTEMFHEFVEGHKP